MSYIRVCDRCDRDSRDCTVNSGITIQGVGEDLDICEHCYEKLSKIHQIWMARGVVAARHINGDS